MIKLYMDPPERGIGTWLPREEIASIFREYRIYLANRPEAADLELVSGSRLDHALPRHRVIVMTHEPPQPENMELAYTGAGFAGVLNCLTDNVYPHDDMAYFLAPPKSRKKITKKNSRISQLASYRSVGGQLNGGTHMAVEVNGKEMHAVRVLCVLRSQVGIELKRMAPEQVDLYGTGFPPDVPIVEDSRKDEKYRVSKFVAISQTGFNLCWENMEIPHYVSEKFWDSLCCGALPMYWGPAGFHARIPKDTITDCRQYYNIEKKTFDSAQLLYDVNAMSEAEYIRRMNTLYEWHDSFPRNTRQKSILVAAHMLAQAILDIVESKRQPVRPTEAVA